MSEDQYRLIFAKNLKHYMEVNQKNQMDLVNDLNLNKSAVSTWCNGTRLPRMEKVDLLARYFGITRSDLIETHQDAPESHYYMDDETRRIAQEIFENKDMRALFDMSRKMTPDRLKAHIQFMQNLQDSDPQ